jgi:heme-degrading monooxygenase HmoA
MITELAILRISPDANASFEAAVASVENLLATAAGHIRHRLASAIDRPDLYLLEVDWRDLAAYTECFEPSSAHAQFMEALGPFLVAEPMVLHVPTKTQRTMEVTNRPVDRLTG